MQSFAFPSLTLMGSPYGGRNWLVLARTTCADMCEYVKLDFRAIACYDGRMVAILEVTHHELADLWFWADTLHVSEFVARVYERWPHLRRLVPGTEVHVRVC